LIKQLYRYGLVGLASNAAGYLAYLLLTAYGTAPLAAMTALYAVGATAGFVGNRKLTFQHEGGLLGSAARYILAHLGGYLLNFAILYVLIDGMGYPHQLAQTIGIVVVALFLFTVFKLFVFSTAVLHPAEAS
jgi:putative flippase GtrA